MAITPIESKYINMPTTGQNHCEFDGVKVLYYLNKREESLPILYDTLIKSNNEAEICEALYISDRLAENVVKDVDKMYPAFSRFNNTRSPNIQTFLAGVYRKTKVPDAFGPLVSMLINNTIHPLTPKPNFDPNEEIGGAILDYLS